MRARHYCQDEKFTVSICRSAQRGTFDKHVRPRESFTGCLLGDSTDNLARLACIGMCAQARPRAQQHEQTQDVQASCHETRRITLFGSSATCGTGATPFPSARTPQQARPSLWSQPALLCPVHGHTLDSGRDGARSTQNSKGKVPFPCPMPAIAAMLKLIARLVRSQVISPQRQSGPWMPRRTRTCRFESLEPGGLRRNPDDWRALSLHDLYASAAATPGYRKVRHQCASFFRNSPLAWQTTTFFTPGNEIRRPSCRRDGRRQGNRRCNRDPVPGRGSARGGPGSRREAGARAS